jgi:hypothetical protein
MPNKPIKIEFTAETDKYERGLKDAERATEKLADTLEKDIPRASEKAADKAEQDFDRIEREARDAGSETGRNFSQSLGEGLGSGDLSEVVQETLGEAVGSMSGPVSAAVGLVAGAGLLIWNKMRQEAEKMNEAITTQTQSMWSTVMGTIESETLSTFAKINKETVINKEFMRLWDEDPEGMIKAQESAAKLNISANDIARAHAGDEEALARVNAKMDQMYATADLTTAEGLAQVEAAKDLQDEVKIGTESWAQLKAQTEGINTSLGNAGVAAGILDRTIRAIPSKIPIEIQFTSTGDVSDARNITGGAWAAGSGIDAGIYQPRKGAAG